MSERPNNPESQKAFFDPKEMARLETLFVKDRKNNNQLGLNEYEIEMHKEQFDLNRKSAEIAVGFLVRERIPNYFKLISREGRDFNPARAASAYFALKNKIDNKTPVPVEETKDLLKVMYNIEEGNLNLDKAIEAKTVAFMHKKQENWNYFQYYLEIYYQYLKMAANNRQDYIIK